MKRATVAGLLLIGACSAPVREPLRERDTHRSTAQARDAFLAGDLVRARVLYEHALALAQLADDPEDAGDAGFDLALVHAESGDFERAERVLVDVEACFVRRGTSLVDLHLLRARIAWLRGDAAFAERALAAAQAATTGPERGRTERECALLAGHLACDRKDIATARTHLATVRRLGAEDPEVLHLAGHVEATAGNAQAAATLWDREATLLQSSRSFRRMGHALVRAGEAHALAGAPALACDRLLRAARSRLAAGDRAGARALATRAQELATRSGDAALVQRATALGEDSR